MSIKETIEAIENAPDNLIYVEPEGRIQLNDLRELAEAYENLEPAATDVVRFFHQQGREVPQTVRELADAVRK